MILLEAQIKQDLEEGTIHINEAATKPMICDILRTTVLWTYDSRRGDDYDFYHCSHEGECHLEKKCYEGR